MPSISQQFNLFLRDNPHVYKIMARDARKWVSARQGKLGIRMLWERARWEISWLTTTDPDYKLNDHYTPYYARLLMHFEPDLAGVFDLRSSPEADQWLQDFINRGGRPT
jgi:hypothetical protein